MIFFLYLLPTHVLSEDGLSKILRKAILRGGYESPQSLYVNNEEELASEGEVLFKSKHMSLNSDVSCSTCHISSHGSSDGISNAAGIGGSGEGKERLLSGARIVPRNTLGFWGVGSKGFKVFFWDGRVDFSHYKVISQFGSNLPSKDPLVTSVHIPVVEIRETLEEDAFIISHTQESTITAVSVYKAIVENLKTHERKTIEKIADKIGINYNEVTYLHVATSVASFIRKEFQIKNTVLNEFVTNRKSLTSKQLEGGILFYGKGNCASCHNGPHFTDQKFYTVPFPQLGFGKNGFGIDYGRYNVTFNPDDLYKFRTPSLYNNGKTAPYGHSGSVMTLYDSIKAHYDPLSIVNINEYDELQRHEYYKYLSKSDTVNRVNFLTDSEVLLIIEFLRILDFD